ncbi:ATP-dependent RNA helicase bel-like [Rhopalosiphum maidis]|uniref:ATP-dependent RNA helicase bel-like n=1 Tax=Rhopalosiphum maidis TaxID=43146 RepID=UPI000EFFEAF9|nr:ATP-dependent RNA helicase bel-like [Rhopalosiphum maidis]
MPIKPVKDFPNGTAVVPTVLEISLEIINKNLSHLVTKIYKNTKDVKSDVESDLERNSNIDYCTPGSSGTDSSFEQIINKSASISSNFEKIYKISSNNNKIQKVEINGMNSVEFKEMQTSMKYNGIHVSLSVNLSYLRYQKATVIQYYAIPILISGRDIIARTPTSSGKTIAFVVPIINCILGYLSEINGIGHRSDYSGPLAIIVVPTIQRVKNVYNVVSRLIANSAIKCEPLIKIDSVSDQKSKIQNGAHILISDPECLAGIVIRGWITFAELRIIVLDDVDSLLKVGYKPEIEFILNNKSMVSTDKRTTVLFSTTMSEDVQQIAMTYLKSNYVSIDIEEMADLEEAYTTQETNH